MTLPTNAPICSMVPNGTADQHLVDYVRANGFERVFLVTGHRSFSWFEETGFIGRLSAIATVARWSGGRPNPDFVDLLQGIDALSACAPDVIVGVGGGSVLDMAKLLAVLCRKPDINPDMLLKGVVDPGSRNVALVLAPTTAGSGAEATRFSVLYKDGVKYSISGRGFLPDQIVLDPYLVTSGSSHQLATSGLDALCQCIESLWAKGSTIESRQMAEEGLRVVAQNIVRFVNGDKKAAREMLWGSHLSGHAINTSKTTAPHALSYFLTTRLGVPHGIAVASTLGYFINHHTRTVTSSSVPNGLDGEVMILIREGLGLRGNESAVEYFRTLFARLQLKEPEHYWPKDAPTQEEWVRSANPERLGNHPEPFESKDLNQILGFHARTE